SLGPSVNAPGHQVNTTAPQLSSTSKMSITSLLNVDSEQPRSPFQRPAQRPSAMDNLLAAIEHVRHRPSENMETQEPAATTQQPPLHPSIEDNNNITEVIPQEKEVQQQAPEKKNSRKLGLFKPSELTNTAHHQDQRREKPGPSPLILQQPTPPVSKTPSLPKSKTPSPSSAAFPWFEGQHPFEATLIPFLRSGRCISGDAQEEIPGVKRDPKRAKANIRDVCEETIQAWREMGGFPVHRLDVPRFALEQADR
ncbi:MAG: hypothetical protein Q9218_008378, partial [Villophora microphyllina]